MISKYYDSCVFGNAINSGNSDYIGCVRATEVERIEWTVCASPDLVLAEFPSIREFFEAFFVYCQINGVEFMHVTLAQAKASAKTHRVHKRQLEVFGFQGRDWNHLMAAKHSGSTHILSTDEDFFDPANKTNRRAARRGNRVAQYIADHLRIQVERP